MERTKVYKPEITVCPLCGAKLKYRYTVSNKVIRFFDGHFVRVKNLGYSCTNDECIDNSVIYSSQTASKLCIKGYTYSSKILAYIVVMKHLKYSREDICDKLALMGVEISDRNIDIINEKYSEKLNKDYKESIKLEYQYMKSHFGQIRISIDCLIVEDIRVISVRNSFNNHQIGIHFINRDAIEETKKLLHEYVDDDAIKAITTVRSITEFFNVLNSVVNREMKYYYFEKF